MEQFINWFKVNVAAPWYRFRAALPIKQKFTPREFKDWALILEGKDNEVPKERRDALRLKVNGPAPEAKAA